MITKLYCVDERSPRLSPLDWTRRLARRDLSHPPDRFEKGAVVQILESCGIPKVAFYHRWLARKALWSFLTKHSPPLRIRNIRADRFQSRTPMIRNQCIDGFPTIFLTLVAPLDLILRYVYKHHRDCYCCSFCLFCFSLELWRLKINQTRTFTCRYNTITPCSRKGVCLPELIILYIYPGNDDITTSYTERGLVSPLYVYR